MSWHSWGGVSEKPERANQSLMFAKTKGYLKAFGGFQVAFVLANIQLWFRVLALQKLRPSYAKTSFSGSLF